MRRCALFALVAWGLLAAPAFAADCSLYWHALEVQAQLDRDGRLHVRERHTMMFTGAWNGGERGFRLAGSQRLQLLRLSRIDPATGMRHPLRPGDLSAIDQYKWFDHNILRWRSRLPSDPPFQETERIYEIEYVLSNILVPEDGSYLLSHDFAFPNRQWPIRRFTLDLQWDSAWQAGRAFTGQLVRTDLQPGESAVITLPFRYAAGGSPAGVTLPAAPWWRDCLIIALLGFIAWRAVAFYRYEKSMGRYAPLTPLARIDDGWLAQNVFSLPPETVGAAWDKTTSAPEVAAMLARLVAEGKLESEVETKGFWIFRRDVLHLKLLCPRSAFAAYELKLIDGLFFDGDTTDSDRIRKHYDKSGFNPVNKISGTLTQRLKSKGAGQITPPSRRLTIALILVAFALGGISYLQDPAAGRVLGIAALIALGVSILSTAGMFAYDDYIAHPGRFGLLSFTLLLPLAAALVYIVGSETFTLGPVALTALALLCAALFNRQFNAMRSRDTVEFTLLRKRLVSARRYFEKELQTESPRLKDAWFPYLLAFGLGPKVDRWFRSYGRDGSVSTYSTNTTTGGRSTSDAWTGGGGSFGGAGATGSWATAVAGIAAGVGAASSSSGGGGGGGSSGGGGGGGW